MRFPHRLLICWSEISHQANRSSCLSSCFQPVRSHTAQSKAAHIQRALHDPGVFFRNCDFSELSRGALCRPFFFYSELTSALHSHKTLLAAIQQNSAYVIMQIYLFIVCIHATGPNMPFFFVSLGKAGAKSRRQKKKKEKKKWPLTLSCRAGGEAAENVTQRSVIPAGLGLEAASPLFSSAGLEGWAVSTHRGHAFSFFFPPACRTLVHAGGRKKKNTNRSGKQ